MFNDPKDVQLAAIKSLMIALIQSKVNAGSIENAITDIREILETADTCDDPTIKTCIIDTALDQLYKNHAFFAGAKLEDLMKLDKFFGRSDIQSRIQGNGRKIVEKILSRIKEEQKHKFSIDSKSVSKITSKF